MKYYVVHPNFKTYLFLLPEPRTLYYKESGFDAVTVKHEWKDTPQEATPFDSEREARNHFTSPLCDIETH